MQALRGAFTSCTDDTPNRTGQYVIPLHKPQMGPKFLSLKPRTQDLLQDVLL